jgi:hypothetical protein
MRLRSVSDVITNSSSELFVVSSGDVRAAWEEFEELWDAWRADLPLWQEVPLDGYLVLDDSGWTNAGESLQVLGVSYGLPRAFRQLLRDVSPQWSEYLDG